MTCCQARQHDKAGEKRRAHLELLLEPLSILAVVPGVHVVGERHQERRAHLDGGGEQSQGQSGCSALKTRTGFGVGGVDQVCGQWQRQLPPAMCVRGMAAPVG